MRTAGGLLLADDSESWSLIMAFFWKGKPELAISEAASRINCIPVPYQAPGVCALKGAEDLRPLSWCAIRTGKK
jgi:hypothetical protein